MYATRALYIRGYKGELHYKYQNLILNFEGVVYYDFDFTMYRGERTGYNRLVKDIFEGEYNIDYLIIVGNINRLTRSKKVLERFKQNVKTIKVLQADMETLQSI